MLFEVLGDIWPSSAIRTSRRLDNPSRQKPLVDALTHRLNEIDKRRTAHTTPIWRATPASSN